MGRQPKQIYQFGSFRLDTVERLLLRDMEAIPLQPKVFDLLLVLVERRGQLLEKNELMSAVWPDTIVQEGNLANNISILRKILSEDGKQFIVTVPRRGYRFIAPVEQSWERWDATEGSRITFTDGEARAAESPAMPGELIGREVELARLQYWLESALRGERQVAFVTGEPGIGKTALVKTFLHCVAANLRALIAHGQCLEHHGTGEAYLPMLEALNRLCSEPGREQLIELLARRAPTWLAQMPALINVAERAALRREIFGATRERMLREMAETIEALTADTPLVLVIEDLHWSDYSTLDLISALAQRHEPARLLLIGTWRPVEVNLSGHPLKAVKQELQMRRRCAEMPLELLTVASVGEYLAARFPQNCFPDDLAHLIHRRTDGNPLFMINVVDYLLAQGLIIKNDGRWWLKAKLREIEVGVPESIRQMIERQIDRLSGEEQRLLEAASVAGAVFSSADVAAALAEDVVQIEEHCERLTRHGQFLNTVLIDQRQAGTAAASFGFIHALYQNVFYQRVTLSRRSRLHQRIGECKESVYAPRAGEIAAELASHFEHGREYRKAIQYLLSPSATVMSNENSAASRPTSPMITSSLRY